MELGSRPGAMVREVFGRRGRRPYEGIDFRGVATFVTC